MTPDLVKRKLRTELTEDDMVMGDHARGTTGRLSMPHFRSDFGAVVIDRCIG
jgi:hypothetical protein